MTAGLEEILRTDGAAGFVAAVADPQGLDLPPQFANLEGALTEARAVISAGNGDADLAAFVEHAEEARLLALRAEELEMDIQPAIEFDWSDPVGSIREMLGNFIQQIAPAFAAFQSGGIGAGIATLMDAFNDEADPERVAALEAQAAQRAEQADRALEASGVELDTDVRSDVASAAVSGIDTIVPG